MPIAFLAAMAGSLMLHVAALFGTDIDLSGPPEATVISAELKPLPPAAVPQRPTTPPAAKPARRAKAPATTPVVEAQASVEPEAPVNAEMTPALPPPAPEPAKPLLPSGGMIRYAVYKTSLGMQIGQTEQRWQFAEDGSYRLNGVTETTGLAAVFKPTRIEQESRGRMASWGLQPEHFVTLKNGRETNENVDFDWSTAELRFARDASVHALTQGTQDVLSLNFQLAYLGRLSGGVALGVVTGRKYDRYEIDSLGEEEIEVPAGRFRTLHVRAQSETVTEIWIALDQRGLPVKIRFTDKKGDRYEQVATEIGIP